MAAFSLDPEETAIVLIEYQNEFTSEGGKLHEAVKECMDTTNMLENSSKLVKEARNAGCSIVHVPISFEEVSRVFIPECVHAWQRRPNVRLQKKTHIW